MCDLAVVCSNVSRTSRDRIAACIRRACPAHAGLESNASGETYGTSSMLAARPGGADAKIGDPLLSRWDHPDRPPSSRIVVGPGTRGMNGGNLRSAFYGVLPGRLRRPGDQLDGVLKGTGIRGRPSVASSPPVSVPAQRGRRPPLASSSAHDRSTRQAPCLVSADAMSCPIHVWGGDARNRRCLPLSFIIVCALRSASQGGESEASLTYFL